MRIGLLSDRVVVEEKTMSVDSPGGFDEEWVARTTIWARVVRQLPSANAEAMYSGSIRAVAAYKVTIRPLSWLSVENHRLLFNNEVLNISAIDRDAKGYTLVCESGVNRG